MLDSLLDSLSQMSDEELQEFFKEYSVEEMKDMIDIIDEVLEND